QGHLATAGSPPTAPSPPPDPAEGRTPPLSAASPPTGRVGATACRRTPRSSPPAAPWRGRGGEGQRGSTARLTEREPLTPRISLPAAAHHCSPGSLGTGSHVEGEGERRHHG
ncbi:Os08g0378000, partial [Oryza sativa Japonica Group]